MRLSQCQPSTPRESTLKARRTRAAFGALAAMAVVSACAGGATGVTNDAIETDVNFGLPPSASPTPFITDAPSPAPPAAPAPVAVAPGAVAPAPARIPAAPVGVLPPPSMVTPARPAPATPAPTKSQPKPRPTTSGQPPVVGGAPPPASVSRVKCPVAPYGSSAKDVPIDVTNTPPVGSYRLVYSVTQVIGGTKLTTTTYITEDVMNVSAVTSTPNPVQGGDTTVFTFDTVLHLARGATETVTYQVKNNSPYRQASAAALSAQAVGEPDRGIAVESVVLKDSTGATTASSTYVPGVLQLSLPVNVGQSFTGEGADASGGSRAYNGQNLGIKHIDACGTLLDGQESSGMQVIADQATQSSSAVDEAFANNLGGLPIYISQVDPVTGNTVTAQLGQGTPSPLGTDRS